MSQRPRHSARVLFVPFKIFQRVFKVYYLHLCWAEDKADFSWRSFFHFLRNRLPREIHVDSLVMCTSEGIRIASSNQSIRPWSSRIGGNIMENWMLHRISVCFVCISTQEDDSNIHKAIRVWTFLTFLVNQFKHVVCTAVGAVHTPGTPNQWHVQQAWKQSKLISLWLLLDSFFQGV